MRKWFLSALIVGCLTVPACGDDIPGVDLLEECGLICPSEGLIEGNASISGIASIDAFFGAVIDVRAAAGSISASVRAELDALALSVGLEAGAPAADIRGAIEAHVAAHVSGGLTVSWQAPKCEASLEVSAAAAAECQADVEPGSVEVSCEGKCSIDASAQADCSASGTLTCNGPMAQCSGSCSGTCELTAAASCSGTCRGTCNGTCSVTDANGNCNGMCDGTCQGSCELAAGGSCSGSCQGSCEFEAPSCEGGFEAKCEASAEANIDCKGSCEGQATPPSVSAECQATVDAKAEANLECTPPAVDIAWQWSAAVMGDAQAQADFQAFIGSFKARFGGLLAVRVQAAALADVGDDLIAATDGAVGDLIGALTGEANLKVSIGAGCAALEAPNVVVVLGGQVDGVLQAGADIGEIVASVGG